MKLLFSCFFKNIFFIRLSLFRQPFLFQLFPVCPFLQPKSNLRRHAHQSAIIQQKIHHCFSIPFLYLFSLQHCFYSTGRITPFCIFYCISSPENNSSNPFKSMYFLVPSLTSSLFSIASFCKPLLEIQVPSSCFLM